MENNLLRIINHYGYEKQSRKTIEELAELTVAINKYIDDPEENKFKNLIEEIADVEIMIQQLKIIHDIDPGVIYDIKVKKINREINRIAEPEPTDITYEECTSTDFLLEEEEQDERDLEEYMREQEKQEVVKIFTNFLEGYYAK